MEIIGYAVRRNDTGEYWHKINGWNDLPSLYKKKQHASCAGSYHIQRDKRGLLETVLVEVNVKELVCQE